MTRKPRLIIEGNPHHVTQRGNNKQKVFFDDNDYLKYSVEFEKYRRRHNLAVISFCLMPNHVHFIAIPNNTDSLAFTLQNINRRYAQYFNGKYSHFGHVWQGRYYSCPINSNQLLQVVKYVEINPLRAGMANKIEEWEWSSASCRIKRKKSKITLAAVPDIDNQSPQFWKEFLQEYPEAAYTDAIRKHTQSGKLFEGKLVKE